MDKPTAASPAILECPSCEGEPPDAGCERCGQAGHIELTGCPHQQVPRETDQLVQLCEFASRGTLPLAGGTLDQTQWFLDCLQFYQAERAALKQHSDPLGLTGDAGDA